MNNNGKSNAVFLILIPLFFIVALVVLDTVFSYVQNKNLKNVTEDVITNVLTSNEINEEEYVNEIKDSFERRGIDTDMLDVEVNYSGVTVINQHRYLGIFSSLNNNMGAKSEIEILGIKFFVSKNSVARINVTARLDSNNIVVFEYSE